MNDLVGRRIAGGLSPGAEIRYQRVDGCGVILDFQNQSYSVLDELATSMWDCLTGALDTDAEIAVWQSDYGIGADEARRSLTAFAEECTREGLLQASPRSVPRSSEGRVRIGRLLPPVMRAMWALISTASLIHTVGFSRTYKRYAAVNGRGVAAPSEQLLRSFLHAESLSFLRHSSNDCLVRSLALFRYLQFSGVAAEHVMGVRRIPFLAHAWVEFGGRAILAPLPGGFTTIARMGAAEN